MTDTTQAVQYSGVLLGEEISYLISQQRLIANSCENSIQGASYDLRVGTIFYSKTLTGRDCICEAPPSIRLMPGELVSIFTMEDLDLPLNICGAAFGLNSKTSKGLLVMNSGHVDPGFRGPLTVTAINMTKLPLTLRVGDPILTVIFERLSRDARHYEKNTPRDLREKHFADYIANQSARNIVDLVAFSPDEQFVTHEQMNEKAGFALSNTIAWIGLLLAAIFGIVSLVVSILSLIIAVEAGK